TPTTKLKAIMNLACPHCQNMLTVSEQSAGQSMQCPYCGGAVDVPVLPTSPAEPHESAELPIDMGLLTEETPQPVPSPPETPVVESTEDSIYRLAAEPPRPPPSPPPTRPRREQSAAQTAPVVVTKEQPPPPPSAQPPGYERQYSFRLHPDMLGWATVVAVGL